MKKLLLSKQNYFLRIQFLITSFLIFGCTLVFAQKPTDNSGTTLKLVKSYSITTAKPSGNLAVAPDALYSNVTTYAQDALANEEAANQDGNIITALVADSIGFVGGSAPFTLKQFSFSVVNYNTVPVTARPRVRFYKADGANGKPGSIITGATFNPITFEPSSIQVFNATVDPVNYVFTDRSFWVGITFDNNIGATGATLAQMNRLGQAIFNPIDLGNSTDGVFITDAAGSFFSANPVGQVYNVPDRQFNFGWQFVSSKPLPIILKDFQVNKRGSANQLNWTTSQESNSSHFTIERSADGNNFSQIGKVNAAGNSSVTLKYQFTDELPLSGLNYYRLKLVDKDNSQKTSDIVSIRNSSSSLMNVYPNPASNSVTIELHNEKAEVAQVEVTDMNGSRVLQSQVNLNSGLNRVPFNVSTLPSGVYNLNVKTSTGSQSIKISKL